MAITSGFFDAQLVNGEYDRIYNSSDFGSMFDGILNDGIFTSIGDKFKVEPSSGFTINVRTGKAWFMGTWINNSAILPLTLSGPPSPQSRIDAIVIDIDKRNQTRANTIKVVAGTPSSSPSRPALANEDNHKQYPLAYITVSNGVTSISASKIQDMRGTSSCPFISLAEPSITADELMSQLAARGEELINESIAAFQVLYDEMEAAIEAASALTILDNSVSTAKVQNGAVTREKLNSDALYSPVVDVTSDINLSINHLGKTLASEYSETEGVRTITLNDVISHDLPIGFECAIARLWEYKGCRISFSGIRVIHNGEQISDSSSNNVIVDLPSRGSMVALKKFETNSNVGDAWLLTGDAEVV